MKKGATIFVLVVSVAIFCYSGYQLLSYYGADRAAEKEFAELLPPEMAAADAIDSETGELFGYESILTYYEGLREQNDDMVGWLRISKTRITYPVMQTISSPEYYLDKDFKKQYSASGSLFASAISDVDKPTDVVIIYGHRMKTGAMFGTLGDYLESDFLISHEKILLDTFTGRNEYKVYSVFSQAVGTSNEFEYYNYSDFTDKAGFDEFLAQVKRLAQASNPANEPTYGDKILLLSTCEYTHANGRLIVVAIGV